MAEISVIIPVYNVGEKILFCLESLIDQSFKDIEYIFIDDGYDDVSFEFLNDFKSAGMNTKILRIPHSGAAVARNTGLDNCTGKYIGFVDADDTIPPDYYEKLYSEMISNDVDTVHTAHHIIYNRSIHASSTLAPGIYRGLINQFGALCGCVIWNKLYNAEIIRKHSIYFPAGKHFEDYLFTVKYMLFSKAMKVINEPRYNYVACSHPNYFSPKEENEFAKWLYKESLEFAKKQNLSDEEISAVKKFADDVLGPYINKD